MSLAVKDLAEELLAYCQREASDAMPTGAKIWLVDAIGGAIDEMLDKAPALFAWSSASGILKASATVQVTVDATDPTKLAVATAGIIQGFGCTLRLGAVQDFSITSYAHPVCLIAPGYQLALGTTLTATTWHDAFAVTGVRCNDRTIVLINGRELLRVQGREQAMRGHLDHWPNQSVPGTGVQRQACQTNDIPAFWWLEYDQTDGSEYIMVYPMPATVMAIEVKATKSSADLDPITVLQDMTTFGLSDNVARSIWKPLALRIWSGKPLFANGDIRPEIARKALEAEQMLAGMIPKAPALPGWNERPGPGYGHRRHR